MRRIEEEIRAVLRARGEPLTFYELILAIEQRRREASSAFWKWLAPADSRRSALCFRPLPGSMYSALERLRQEGKLVTEREAPPFPGAIPYFYHRLSE